MSAPLSDFGVRQDVGELAREQRDLALGQFEARERRDAQHVLAREFRSHLARMLAWSVFCIFCERFVPMRTLAALLIAGLVIVAPVPLGAWGMEVHKDITRRALDALPAELKPFFDVQREFIIEHSVDPDLWRIVDLRGDRGDEEPNHFIDIDGLDEPRPFTNVPREWDAYVKRYGLERANTIGRLPWRIEEIFGTLVTRLREAGQGTPAYAAANARYLAAVLAHYIEDAHQPFHAVLNYNGQLTGQQRDSRALRDRADAAQPLDHSVGAGRDSSVHERARLRVRDRDRERSARCRACSRPIARPRTASSSTTTPTSRRSSPAPAPRSSGGSATRPAASPARS